MHYRFESLEIDSDALLLRVDGIELKVDVRCVELLVLLIEAWPGYCESTELLQQLWPSTEPAAPTAVLVIAGYSVGGGLD